MTTASRRSFLRSISAFAAGGIVAPYGLDLAGMAAASAQSASDYKALVCVYLGGGNDHLSMIAPYDTASHARYAQVRSGLALPRASLLPLAAASSQGGRQAGFSPNMSGLKSLYDGGRLAVVAGVGPLIAPVTRADITAGRAPLPKLLGSHLDQSNTWQSLADPSRFGWGGRFADLLAASNATPTFTTISAAGYALFTVGTQTSSFSVSEAGAPNVFYAPGSRLDTAINGSAQRTNLLEQEYSRINESLRDGAGAIGAAILPEAGFAVAPGGGRNQLAQQLLTVARIIGGNRQLGVKRQIFYVDIGGFDTHLGQNDRHPALMTQVNDAMVYFDTMLGQIGLRDNVTLFTTSEFGRTYVPNGDGTDHGWGSHHLVMGGAVKGGNIYGSLPSMEPGGPDFTDNGQMIPTIAAAQYAATLGKWMGVGGADLATILPDLGRFNTPDLGFLR
jgi:uncharacterized protein (DUF1501 family)